MKIVLLGTVSSSIFGFRKPLLQSLVEEGHDVYILTTDLTPETRRRAKDELNVSAEKYTLSRTGLNPIVDIRNAWRLYRHLKIARPDYVFCYFAKPVIWGAVAARFAGVKYRFGMLEGLGYYFTDDPEGNSRKKRSIRRVQIELFRLVLPSLSGLVVLNPDDKSDIVVKYGVRQNNVMVLGGIGLDFLEFPHSEPDVSRVRFVFVGRLLAEKGINVFLRAAEQVKQRYPEAEFVILGEPDLANPGSVDGSYLNQLVENGTVINPGLVSNVAEWLASSSVFVLPSYYREGVPRSTQEAMAIGRAIITTDVPGCRETIWDGENGFMVPPHNPQAVAKAMEKFISDPDLILSMGQRSRALAEQFFNATEVNQRLKRFLGLT